MTYSRPPLYGQFPLTTNAVANTLQTDVLLAAPGAGLAYRIVAINPTILQNGAAGAITRLLFTDAATLIVYWQSILTMPKGSDHVNIVEPGILLSPNSAFSVQDVSTAAAQGVRVVVHYYIDSV